MIVVSLRPHVRVHLSEGSGTVLQEESAMIKERHQTLLREELLPITHELFADKRCLFQHDGAPSHETKVITKRLGSAARKLPRPKFYGEPVGSP